MLNQPNEFSMQKHKNTLKKTAYPFSWPQCFNSFFFKRTKLEWKLMKHKKRWNTLTVWYFVPISLLDYNQMTLPIGLHLWSWPKFVCFALVLLCRRRCHVKKNKNQNTVHRKTYGTKWCRCHRWNQTIFFLCGKAKVCFKKNKYFKFARIFREFNQLKSVAIPLRNWEEEKNAIKNWFMNKLKISIQQIIFISISTNYFHFLS